MKGKDMKIFCVKKCRWSVNYEVREFEEGQFYDIEDRAAIDMIKSGYATETKPEKITKLNIVSENKAIETAEENKQIDQEEKEEADKEGAEEKPNKKHKKGQNKKK